MRDKERMRERFECEGKERGRRDREERAITVVLCVLYVHCPYRWSEFLSTVFCILYFRIFITEYYYVRTVFSAVRLEQSIKCSFKLFLL
jgi:hypothetical protein